jgi:hypothetical protein
METIISIPSEFKHFESMAKLARKKHDENLKLSNVIKIKGTLNLLQHLHQQKPL